MNKHLKFAACNIALLPALGIFVNILFINILCIIYLTSLVYVCSTNNKAKKLVWFCYKYTLEIERTIF